MLIIGLMVIALICLAVGLVLPSSAWLIASLIATAGAGYLVWKMRSAIAPAGAAGSGSAAAAGPADADQPDRADAMDQTAVIDAVDAAPDSTADTSVISAVPAHDATQVIPAVPADAVRADPGDVWVIDGRPRYHLGTCPIIQGQDAEPIPFDQAVEDGFMPCSLCEPNMARTSR